MKEKIFKPAHELPGAASWDYILLPFGEFYSKTKVFLDAKAGDVLRFFNGPEREIKAVRLIDGLLDCEFFCRMRYGVSWELAFARWLSYARLEGNSKNVLCPDKCILIAYGTEDIL